MQSNYKYAKTLFDLGKRSNCLSLIQSQLKSVTYLYNKIPVFKLVFVTKRINTKTKIEIINNVLKNFEPLIVEFISILIQNNQTNNLLGIVAKYNNMVNTDSDISKIEVTTSKQLSDVDSEYISKTIKSQPPHTGTLKKTRAVFDDLSEAASKGRSLHGKEWTTKTLMKGSKGQKLHDIVSKTGKLQQKFK